MACGPASTSTTTEPVVVGLVGELGRQMTGLPRRHTRVVAPVDELPAPAAQSIAPVAQSIAPVAELFAPVAELLTPVAEALPL